MVRELYGLKWGRRPDMDWPNPGPAPVWPPPAEEGWYRFEASEFGRSVGARTETGSTSFSGAGGGWATGKLSEDSSGKAIYEGGGGGGMTYQDKLLGCFSVPGPMLDALRVTQGTVVAVTDHYNQRLYARVAAAPGALASYLGEPYRRIPIPADRPASERAAWEAEVAAWCAAYERAVREAFEAFAASEAGKQAEAAQALRDAAAALVAKHGTPAPAPWYLFGVDAAEVLAAHPTLVAGMGVSRLIRGSQHRPELVPGSAELLALHSTGGRGGKRHSYRVNWERSVGVHPLSCEGSRSEIRLVAAVDPGFVLVAESYTDGKLNWSRAWDASGEREVPAPISTAAGFGTFADLLRK